MGNALQPFVQIRSPFEQILNTDQKNARSLQTYRPVVQKLHAPSLQFAAQPAYVIDPGRFPIKAILKQIAPKAKQIPEALRA